jgi:hypothetical protein
MLLKKTARPLRSALLFPAVSFPNLYCPITPTSFSSWGRPCSWISVRFPSHLLHWNSYCPTMCTLTCLCNSYLPSRPVLILFKWLCYTFLCHLFFHLHSKCGICVSVSVCLRSYIWFKNTQYKCLPTLPLTKQVYLRNLCASLLLSISLPST